MKLRGKWFWMAAVLAGLVITYGGLLLVLPEAGPTLQVLPDGSTLSLASVTFSTNTTVSVAGMKGWQRRLFPLVPARVRSRLGWQAGGGSLKLVGEPGETNLMVAMVGRLKGAESLSSPPRLLIADDEGNWWGAVGSYNGMKSSGAKGGVVALEAWRLPMFPRRGRQLSLRIVGPGVEGPQKVAEFTVPNPAFRDYPQWRAEPLPTTQTNGNLRVTLRSLVSDYAPAGVGAPTVTRAAFSLARTEGGAPGVWEAASLVVADATGNQWVAFTFKPWDGERTNLNEILLPGALWPGESAWRLRLELTPATDFAAEDLVTLAGVSVPSPTNTLPLYWTTNLPGGSLKLIALSGGQSQPPANINFSVFPDRVNPVVPGSWNLSVLATLRPGGAPRRLRLVAAVDDAGRGVGEITENADRLGLKVMYAFTPATNARSLSFTFALPASRFFEFQARPDFPPAKAKGK